MTGRRVAPVDPVYDVGVAASAIVRLAEAPQRERPAGGVVYALDLSKRLAPRLTERLTGQYASRTQFPDGAAPHDDGNLFAALTLLRPLLRRRA